MMSASSRSVIAGASPGWRLKGGSLIAKSSSIFDFSFFRFLEIKKSLQSAQIVKQRQ
jgi:hypothetical protein